MTFQISCSEMVCKWSGVICHYRTEKISAHTLRDTMWYMHMFFLWFENRFMSAGLTDGFLFGTGYFVCFLENCHYIYIDIDI